MRSHLALLSIASLAILGCGKDVEKNGRPASGQINTQPSSPVETRPGACADPIQTNYKPIQRFSDISSKGRYELRSMVAVGTAVQGAGTPNPAHGISVVNATADHGELAPSEVCRDLNMMPQAQYRWSVSAPSAISASTGMIEKSSDFSQTVYGPAIVDSTGAALKPENHASRSEANTSVDRMIESRDGTTVSTFYQIDATTVGVLRVTTTIENGMSVESKTFAKYTVSSGKPPRPKPQEPSKPGRPKPPTGGQGSGGQGKKGGSSKEGPSKGGQGEGKGGQGSGGQGSGGQGSGGQGSTHTTSTTSMPSTTTSTTPTVLLPRMPSDGTSKVKIDVKVKTNESTGREKRKIDVKIKENSSEGSTKIKYDEKLKTDAGDDDSKHKIDIKVKETSAEGSSKLKVDVKDKVNGDNGNEKHKLVVKKKERDENSSSKSKLKIKVKTRG